MSGFLSQGSTTATQPTRYYGLNITTSLYGVPVQKGYGTNRAAPNLIWTGNFFSIADGSSGGGKGGSAAGGATGYDYGCSVMMSLGCGPINGVGTVWQDENAYASLAAFLGAETGLLFTGTYPQSAWSYLSTLYSPVTGSVTSYQGGSFTSSRNYFIRCTFLTASGETLPNAESEYTVQNSIFNNNLLQVSPPTNIPTGATGWNLYIGLTTGSEKKQNSTPLALTANWKEPSTGLVNLGSLPVADTSLLSQALPYNGIAYFADENLSLGHSPNLPNLNFEVQWGSFVSGLPDADPSLVITDMLTNAHDGIQFPAGMLASTTNLQNYVLSAGLLISPLYTTQQAVATTITDLCAAINVAPIWTSGQLSFAPFGDTAISGNGKSWTPPASVFNFTDDDFQPNQYASGSAGSGNNQDPVIMTRPDQSKVINSITLEYYDRTNNYDPATVQYKNLAMITQFGETPEQTSRDGHMFCLAAQAQISIMLQGNRELGRNMYQWSLDARGCLYDPMDIGTITDTYLGITQVLVRILEITENDDGTFTFSAEELLQGTGHSPGGSSQTGAGFTQNYEEDPGNTNAPVMFEAPAAITTNGGLETWIAMSGGPTWGGAEVWVSTNNNDYGQIGTQHGPARTGTLVQSILSTDTSMIINLEESQGALLTGTAVDAANGTTLCWLDDELISYQTATLISAFNYQLTGCVRAFYGTTAMAHAAGVQFARLDSQIFKIPHSKLQIGQALSIKLLSFNIYGGGQQTL